MSELFHSLIIIGSIIPQHYGGRNGKCSENIQENLRRSADGTFFLVAMAVALMARQRAGGHRFQI
jgi:hypothetical protein